MKILEERNYNRFTILVTYKDKNNRWLIDCFDHLSGNLFSFYDKGSLEILDREEKEDAILVRAILDQDFTLRSNDTKMGFDIQVPLSKKDSSDPKYFSVWRIGTNTASLIKNPSYI